MIKGIKIATTNSGVKYKNRDDLLLVTFEKEADVAGIFTSSSMPAAPVTWCKKHIANGKAKALIVNAGNANAFTGAAGEETVLKTANAVATGLNCGSEKIFIASTGVIGETLDANLITAAIPTLLANPETDESAWEKAAKAIMTTDTAFKLVKKTCYIGEKTISLIGLAKGSGMIAPNMATMLGYIFTDANISATTLKNLLVEAGAESFNAITVDSDQSTNDTVMIFATGEAGNQSVSDASSPEITDFKNALNALTLDLAKKIVIDGEGAKKLIEVKVEGALNKSEAKRVAFSIANSPLVKTAIAACDPNWGRIVMAAGKSCKETSPEKITIYIGQYQLTKDGQKHPDYVEALVHDYLKNSEVTITVNLGIGSHESTVWTCDLNEEYVSINKDYRS